MSETNANPKVFISYSWGSVSHQKFVLDLAEKLTTDGVLVVIDKWDLKEGQNKYAFMEQMISDKTVSKVLIISDKKYSEKADNKTGGVGTESEIISSEIYNKIEQTKFIPIVCELNEKEEPYLPIFLKSRMFINFSSNSVFYDEYDKLLRNIYDKPSYKKPALGNPPTHIFEESHTVLLTQHKYLSLKEALLKEMSISKSLCLEYFDEFIVCLEKYRLPEVGSQKPIDDQLLDNLKEIKVYRDQLFDVYKHIISTTQDMYYIEVLFEFFEKTLLLIYAPASNGTFSDLSNDNYKFFNYENYLYFISLLIKYKRYDAVKYFTEEKYYIRSGYNRGVYGFSAFNSYIKTLDEYRKNKLKLNSISLSTDILKERCDFTSILFEDIMQSDFILSLKSVLDNNYCDSWFPRTLLYKGWYPAEPFIIFLKAESKKYFDVIAKIFNVKNKEELIEKFKIASENHNLQKWRFDYRSIPFETFMNLNNLYK